MDGRSHILGEIRIDGGRRIFGHQSNAFGNRATRRLDSAKNGNRLFLNFDDDLCSGAHTVKQGRNIRCNGLSFGNMDSRLLHLSIIHPISLAYVYCGDTR